MTSSSARLKECSRKELLSLLPSVLEKLHEGKIKKMNQEQFKALYHFLNGQDKFACLPTGHGKTLIYQIAVLVTRTGKVKILPSNALVVVVSPLNALISDQLESCQRLKLKAVKMEQELFDNDDKLTELEEAEVVYVLQTSRDGSVAKPWSMLNKAIFDPWQRSLFSRQRTSGKEPLLAGKYKQRTKVKYMSLTL